MGSKEGKHRPREQTRFENSSLLDLCCPLATCVDPREAGDDVYFLSSEFNKSLIRPSLPTVFDNHLAYPLPSYIGTRLKPAQFAGVKLAEAVGDVALPAEAIDLLVKSATRTRTMPTSDTVALQHRVEDEKEAANNAMFSQKPMNPVRQTRFDYKSEMARETQLRNILTQFETPAPLLHPDGNKRLWRSFQLDLCTDYQNDSVKLAVFLKEQRRTLTGYTLECVEGDPEGDDVEKRYKLLVVKNKDRGKGSRRSKSASEFTNSGLHKRKSKLPSWDSDDDEDSDDDFSPKRQKRSGATKGIRSPDAKVEKEDSFSDFDLSDSDSDTNLEKQKAEDESKKGTKESHEKERKKDASTKSRDHEKSSQNSQDTEGHQAAGETNDSKKHLKSSEKQQMQGQNGDDYKILSAFLYDNIINQGRTFALFIPRDGSPSSHAMILPLPGMIKARDTVPLINGELKLNGKPIYNVKNPIRINYIDEKTYNAKSSASDNEKASSSSSESDATTGKEKGNSKVKNKAGRKKDMDAEEDINESIDESISSSFDSELDGDSEDSAFI